MNSKKKKNISKLKDNWHKSKEREIEYNKVRERVLRTHTTIGIKNVVSSKNKIVNLSIPNEGKTVDVCDCVETEENRKNGEGNYKGARTNKKPSR